MLSCKENNTVTVTENSVKEAVLFPYNEKDEIVTVNVLALSFLSNTQPHIGTSSHD